MKYIWNIIYIVIGLICIYIGLNSGYLTLAHLNSVQSNPRGYVGNVFLLIFLYGLIMVIFSIFWTFYCPKKSTGEKTADEYNFRDTDSDENCTNCKYYDSKSLADCKLFKIKIDENYVCDLLTPSVEED